MDILFEKPALSEALWVHLRRNLQRHQILRSKASWDDHPTFNHLADRSMPHNLYAMKYLLSLDQGTTSSRSILFDEALHPVAMAQREFAQHFPQPGWVEHDAMEIWHTTIETARTAIKTSNIRPRDIKAIGITNQRETIVVWDRKTGHPVYPAIVWQDRRTSGTMNALRDSGREDFVQEKTGLLLDPYFSASKIPWILGHIPNGRARALAGELAVGTIDSWLIFKLTGGASHITDVSNASRTMLMNIHTGEWDPDLLALFDIPRAILPRITSSCGDLAVTDGALFGFPIPIRSAIGDQQSALFAQLCFEPGRLKCTYGTGCFLLQFTGSHVVSSKNRLLTTVAWQLGNEPIQYALEGSVFTGGAAIQWLRDGLGIIHTSQEVNDLAAQVPDSGGVILVPAFTGLGAPYWDSSARASLLGLTRGTTAAHIARATLDGIAFQVADLVSAMEKDSGHKITHLRVDGGASASDLLMQIQADLLGIPVERPANIESTALGAAMLAGLASGWWPDLDSLSSARSATQRFEPALSAENRLDRLDVWHRAVPRAQNWDLTL